MKRVLVLWAALVGVGCASQADPGLGSAVANAKAGAYVPTPFSEIRGQVEAFLAEIPPGSPGPSTLLVPPQRHQFRLRYEGKSRPLDPDTQIFMAHAAKSFPFVPQQQWDAYTEELWVSASSQEPFWAVAQNATTRTLLPDLSDGEEFEVYAFWVGARDSRPMVFINAARTFGAK